MNNIIYFKNNSKIKIDREFKICILNEKKVKIQCKNYFLIF